jgi:hypothetical protein
MPIPVADDDPIVTPDLLSTYLNDPSIDTDRATLIINQAIALCETIEYPLPTDPDGVNQYGAQAVVLDVAQRAYSNPTSARSSNSALYSEEVGPFSDGNPGSIGGGLWLTENNKSTLRQLAGGGGAFMIDTLASDFVPCLPPWDNGNWYPGLSGF